MKLLSHKSTAAVFLALLFILSASDLFAESLRIASYNARNYNLIDRRVDGHWRQQYPKPEQEKEAFRRVIHLIDADIIAFQEIGPDPAFLKELQRDLRREGLDYPFLIHMKGPDADRALGVISKIEPNEINRHAEISYTLGGARKLVRRGLLEITFLSNSGEQWQLFNIHLKSRLSEDPDDPEARKQRTGEARAVRDFIQDRYGQNARYIILGDLNDTPDSPAMQRLLKKGDSTLAIDTRAKDSRMESWTYFYARSETYERIDVMLISPMLVDSISSWRSSVFDNPIWQIAGDHRPVILDIAYRETEASGGVGDGTPSE